MKINRTLKHGAFEWDEKTKMFKIQSGEYSVQLSKVYAFAFLRFVFRVAQRNWLRKPTKPQKESKLEICDKQIRETKFVPEQFLLPHCEEFSKDEVLEKT